MRAGKGPFSKALKGVYKLLREDCARDVDVATAEARQAVSGFARGLYLAIFQVSV